MAEIGVVASIVQIADIGLRLSLRLYTFGETVASADGSVSAISNDISFTSSILKELGHALEDDKAGICSDNAIKTAEAVVQECSKAFQEMDDLLLKKVPYLRVQATSLEKKSRATVILERLRWPTIKGKIECLRSNLDRMKSTLMLMLNVIIYAKQVSERKETPSTLAQQRQLVEDLANAHEERTFKFHQMRLALEPTYPFPGPSGAQQPEIPTPALNLMGFTGNIRPRSPSKATPADVGRATSTSIVFNDMCDVPSKEIPSTFSSTALDTASIVAQAQKTQSPAFILSSNVEFLLSEFTKLRANLVAEVHSTQYEVAQDVRERFESDINQRHDREKLQVCRRHSLDLAKDVGPCEEDANLTLMSSADSHKTKVGMGSRGPSFETARQCNHHQTMTLQTEIEPIQVPNDVRAPPIVFSEARKRNATASHHFRVKRKEREAAMKSLKPQSPSRERRQRTLSRTREKEHQSTNSVDVYPTQETPICDEAQMNKETRILHSHPSYKPFPITSTDTVESTKSASHSSYSGHYGSASTSAFNYGFPYSSSYSQQYSPSFGHSSSNADPVISTKPKKPQCWEHGCNGRVFSTFSTLLRHQRKKSGTSSRSTCHRCGAEFARKTGRDHHLACDKCLPEKLEQNRRGSQTPHSTKENHGKKSEDSQTVSDEGFNIARTHQETIHAGPVSNAVAGLNESEHSRTRGNRSRSPPQKRALSRGMSPSRIRFSSCDEQVEHDVINNVPVNMHLEVAKQQPQENVKAQTNSADVIMWSGGAEERTTPRYMKRKRGKDVMLMSMKRESSIDLTRISTPPTFKVPLLGATPPPSDQNIGHEQPAWQSLMDAWTNIRYSQSAGEFVVLK